MRLSRRGFFVGLISCPVCAKLAAAEGDAHWNVYEQPIEVAAEDIATFKSLFPMNARPLQALGRRLLLKGA